MSLASATRSFLTTWPLMSRPRMFCAWVKASSGLAAYFTPPALPRPPTFNCAFTMTGVPTSSAMALASSAVSVTRPGVVGTLCLANSSFAWYSKRSMGSLLCVGLVFRLHASPEFSVARLRKLYRDGSEVPSSASADVADLTEPWGVIQITFPAGFLAKLATPRTRRLTCQGPDNVMVTARGTNHVDPAKRGYI